MLFDDMRSLLARARNIAIIGAKDKPGSPVDHVGRYLLNAGFNIQPVHPVRRQAWGIPAVRSIADLPGIGFEPDIICLSALRSTARPTPAKPSRCPACP